MQSGNNFTSDIKGALKQLYHFVLFAIALVTIVSLTNWHKLFFYPLYFAASFIMIRDTSYMQVCVAAQEKYSQWQIPTVVFIVSSISKILFIIFSI